MSESKLRYRIYTMHSAGYSTYEIANTLGISEYKVVSILGIR